MSDTTVDLVASKPSVDFRRHVVSAVNVARRALTPSLLKKYDRLHLGAGWRQLPGWANIDIYGRANLIWDLNNDLPVAPGSIRFIYSEHFIEHIPREMVRQLFTTARQALAGEGVMRISTPDLRFFATAYVEGRVVHNNGWEPVTACQMLNEQMRLWGHLFLYDEDELTALLRECGFTRITRLRTNQSPHPELQNLESRPDCGDLILEVMV